MSSKPDQIVWKWERRCRIWWLTEILRTFIQLSFGFIPNMVHHTDERNFRSTMRNPFASKQILKCLIWRQISCFPLSRLRSTPLMLNANFSRLLINFIFYNSNYVCYGFCLISMHLSNYEKKNSTILVLPDQITDDGCLPTQTNTMNTLQHVLLALKI